MSYPAWPEALPAPRRDEFSVSRAPSVRRVQMETGPDRVTRLSGLDISTATHVVVLSTEQVAAFWSFYNGPANGGADWVLIPTITANAVAMHKCRFRGEVGTVPDGLDWRLSFTLETDEQHIDWS